MIVNFGKGPSRVAFKYIVLRQAQALENVTHYVARATCHRVLSPRPGDGPRYSVPWFQSISQSIRLHDIDLRGGYISISARIPYSLWLLVPNEIPALIQNGSESKTDGGPRLRIMVVTFPYMRVAVNYQEYDQEVTGVVSLAGRIKFGSFSLLQPSTYPPIPGLTQTSQNATILRHLRCIFQMVLLN